jgi:hypothetical protein
MRDFNPLLPTYLQQDEERTLPEFHVTEYQLFKSPLPQSWKSANITPIQKEKPVRNINKHLRPISLSPVISKIAENFVVETFVKPAVLKKKDRNQYGTISNSSIVHALISLIHEWNGSTDGNDGTTRVMLFDFRKAFDLIDHHLQVRKLKTYDLPSWTIDWITDFITCRKQRFKLNQDCYSEWESVTAGVIQGTLLGPWLFIIMMNNIEMYVYMIQLCQNLLTKEK